MLKKIILCSALLLGIGEGLFGATSSYVYDDREDILKKLNVNMLTYYNELEKFREIMQKIHICMLIYHSPYGNN